MDLAEMELIMKNKALKDLPELFELMRPHHAQELAEALEGRALWLLRASVYLETRVNMEGHQQAIKEQNRILRKIRKALSYQMTPDVIW